MISKNQIKFVKQLALKKYRKQEGLFVAEGPKVVGDLLDAGFRPHLLFALNEWNSRGYACQEVNEEELQRVSFLQHPQQVLGVFELPPTPTSQDSSLFTSHSSLLNSKAILSLALDGVQDPGNLGTIIRIADWFGIDTIYCSEDTADAWNPKVVQATMGSIARVNMVYTDLKELILKAKVPVYGTLLDGENIYTSSLTANGIIVMGNEGNGISQEIRSLITHKLRIPQFHEGPESLNVAIATAITCSEFKRMCIEQ